MKNSEKMFLIRKCLNLNQSQFADKLGIGNKQISAIEKGRVQPSPSVLELMFSKYLVNRIWWETGEGDIFDKDLDSTENNSKTDLANSPKMREFTNLMLKLDEKRWRQVLAVIYKGLSEQIIEKDLQEIK